MSDIGTHRQVVDSERFSTGYDATYQRKPSKPGKTVYVCRDGKLVPKEQTNGWVIIEAVTAQANEVNANLRQYNEMVLRGLGVSEEQLSPRADG
jgi:hypothetical protein